MIGSVHESELNNQRYQTDLTVQDPNCNEQVLIYHEELCVIWDRSSINVICQTGH